MYHTALRNVLAHKGRLLMTMLAVLLGTAFVASTLVFSDSVGQSFKDSLSSSFTGISVQVNSDGGGAKDLTAAAVPLTESTLKSIAAVPGAASARGIVTGFAGLSDPHGNLIGNSGSTYGGNWVPGSDGQDTEYPMTQGSGPTDSHSLAIDQKTATDHHFKVGDTVRMAVTGPVVQMTVTGIFSTDGPQVKTGGSLVLFDNATAQSIYVKPGQYTAISAAAKPGVTEDQLLREVKKVIPKGPNIKAETSTKLKEDQASEIATATTGLKAVLLGFAGIALFVGIFLIANTFSMLIAQRTRELALLRAIGASRRQVNRSVLLEALFVGVSASLLGLLVGIGVGAGMQSVMGSMSSQAATGVLVISPTTLAVTLLTGILVTVVSALLPAWRASRIAPVAAMSSNDTPATQRSLIVRNAIGVVLTGIGLVAVVSGTGGSGNNGLVGLGALFTMTGVLVLTPLLSRPVIALAGPPYGRLFGVPGKLARRNALRNPRRTAATASALTIGVTLISMLTVIGTSMNTAIDKQVAQGMKADYLVSAMLKQPVAPALLPAIAHAPGIAVYSALDRQTLEVPQLAQPLSVTGVDTAVLDQLMAPQMVSGSVTALQQGQLLVEQAEAARQQWRVGSSIKATYPDGTTGALTIGGIYLTSDLEGPALMSEAALSPHTAEPSYGGVLVKGRDGATPQLQQALKDVTGDNPMIQVQTHQQIQESFSSRTTLLLDIMYGLLGMAVFIAILGVVNTLAMSVFERKREIGMLRAIGLDRRGIKRMIRLEAVVIAALGAVLGVSIGGFFAWAAVQLSVDAVGDLTTVLPYGQLAAFLVGAVLVGLLAALWPVRQAAALGILDGIKTD